MNIFFTASVRGGRSQQPQYEHVVKVLERYGAVFSEHVSDSTLSQYGETDLQSADILAREKGALAKCDIVVAEVTTPSLGVGYLIAYATSLGKRAIALYCGEDTLKLSAIIKGDSHVETHAYKTGADVEKILETVFRTI